MRALTLTQPWAGLVAAGVKLVENRPRRMIKRDNFGELFALHASREIDEDAYARIIDIDDGVYRAMCLDMSDGMIVPKIATDSRWYKLSRITSAVIAVATIVRDVTESEVETGALEPGQRRWFFGPIGYVLADVRTLTTPVPCKGALGFWTLPADVQRQVEEQLPLTESDVRDALAKGAEERKAAERTMKRGGRR